MCPTPLNPTLLLKSYDLQKKIESLAHASSYTTVFVYSSDLSKKPFFGGLVDYFSSGPIVAMVWEGPEVILTARKMLGATNPNSSEPG